MAAHVLRSGCESLALRAWEDVGLPGEAAGNPSPGRSAAAIAVAGGAMLLAAAPALVAVVAIVSPGELDRVFGWLVGSSAASALVAAGRVPAATLLTLLTLALAGVRARR